MKLYVCYGTFGSPRPGGHPCGNAYHALKDAGHDPEVVKPTASGGCPTSSTPGRREVKQLTGKTWVPVLVTDDDEVISDSKEIVAWAQAHPAGAASQPDHGVSGSGPAAARRSQAAPLRSSRRQQNTSVRSCLVARGRLRC